MKVSVIIPVYGVEPYIEDCLRSVAEQQFGGQIECLIVDDCGPDRSMDVARRFINKYNGPVDFRIIARAANGGLSEARNSGLDAATGDYIYFLDSDDELLPRAISRLAEAIERHRCDMVIGDYMVTGGKHVFPRLYLTDGARISGQETANSYCRNEWYMMAVNKLYSAKFLKENGLRFYPGLIHEDELWSFQCALRAGSIAAISANTYNYKVRPGSIMSAQNARRRALGFKTILTEILKEINRADKKYSADVHRFVRHKLFQLVSFFAEIPQGELLEVYKTYRRQLPLNRRQILKLNGLNPSQLLRDSHLFLPASVGFRLLTNHFKPKQSAIE
ncbi:MAG: glycosyltransferase [Bacteroides sp.]|nr:glycosyltransferase [Bacteroides sp.]MCM1378733.1 glycosyltransferase [Bacteroides sp.]MCM1445350.1 glycosyltransferase [Prevotella sp.]